MLNKYMCIGNLVKDPELVELQSGAKLCKFALAINDPIKKDEVLFMEIECWNKVAESTSKFLKKGAKCLVEGRLVSNSWKSNETVKKKIFVRADFVTFFPRSMNSASSTSKVDELSGESTNPSQENLTEEEKNILEDAPF